MLAKSKIISIVLAIIFCVSVMLIIGLTIVMNISNSTLLYR